jgi:hypothetical protein
MGSVAFVLLFLEAVEAVAVKPRFRLGRNLFCSFVGIDEGNGEPAVTSSNENILASTNAFTVGRASLASNPRDNNDCKRLATCAGLAAILDAVGGRYGRWTNRYWYYTHTPVANADATL